MRIYTFSIATPIGNLFSGGSLRQPTGPKTARLSLSVPYNQGMEIDPQACYRAILARDERYDGRFFVCVKTTGIYCRPICPAGPPKLENCEFVPSAAAAAEAGYRPCLRCKPECSPDLGLWRGTSVTVSRISLLLPYRPPYDWESMLGFLAARIIPGVECVLDQSYHRTIEINGAVGTMQVENLPERSSLRVTVSIPRIDNLSMVVARTRRLFDLSADPVAISSALEQDPDLRPLVTARPGLRVPGAWDGFEIAVRAVLGQQISVIAANKLAAKLVSSFGSPLSEPLGPAGLTRYFPKPKRFDFDSVVAIGMPRKRAEAIVALADAVVNVPQLFDPKPSLEEAIDGFCSLPGIGQWTAQYIAMRVLRESDAFLAGDVALRRILSADGNRISSGDLLARAQRWRPWRAYATLHLWTAESLSRNKKMRKGVDAIEV